MGSGSWTAIPSSDASTNSHTVTGLTGGTVYAFQVRAVVGTGGARVIGMESDAASVTTLADLEPSFGSVTDQIFPQGASVNVKLPEAAGGDNASGYTYAVTPDVSGIGLTFDGSTRTLSGTSNTPQAKTTYTYTATESIDSDGTSESGSVTFTIGIQPKKPADFSATSDGSSATFTGRRYPACRAGSTRRTAAPGRQSPPAALPARRFPCRTTRPSRSRCGPTSARAMRG